MEIKTLLDKKHTPSGIGIYSHGEFLFAGSRCCGARQRRSMTVDDLWICELCDKEITRVAAGSLWLLTPENTLGASPDIEKWVSDWTGYPVGWLAVTLS